MRVPRGIMETLSFKMCLKRVFWRSWIHNVSSFVIRRVSSIRWSKNMGVVQKLINASPLNRWRPIQGREQSLSQSREGAVPERIEAGELSLSKSRDCQKDSIGNFVKKTHLEIKSKRLKWKVCQKDSLGKFVKKNHLENLSKRFTWKISLTHHFI